MNNGNPFYFRGGREVRYFDPREDEVIVSLWRQGKGPAEIARAVSRVGRYQRDRATIAMRLKSVTFRAVVAA